MRAFPATKLVRISITLDTEQQYNADMVSSERINRTYAIIVELKMFDPAKLSRWTQLGGPGNFAEAASIAKIIVDLYKPIYREALAMMPPSQHDSICSIAKKVLATFERIESFDPNADAAPRIRSDLTKTLESLHEELFSRHVGLFVYAQVVNVGQESFLADAARGVQEFAAVRQDAEAFTREIKLQAAETKRDSEKIIQELGEQAAAAKQTAENHIRGIKEQDAKTKQDSEKLAKEAREQLTGIKRLAAELGVSQNAAYFKTEANDHDRLSKKWLWGTIGAATVVVIASIVSLYLPYADKHGNYLAPLAGRIVFFSALGYMLYLCGKTYFSHRHNAVVNRHRQNALSTYRALVQATSNNETTDIVLSHAAASIFSPQSSGYAKSADAPNAISLVRAAREISNSDGK